MFKKHASSMLNISLMFISFFILFYILYIGSSLVIPFIIALLFSFAIIGLSNFYQKFKLWKFLSFILSISTYVFMFWLIGKMIGTNVNDLIRLLPEYQIKIMSIVKQFFQFLNIPEPTSISSVLNRIDLQNIFNSLVSAITSIFSSSGIIFFYVMFILLEYRFFRHKLNLMTDNNSRKREVFGIIEKIKNDIKSYFVIKTIVSFITAGISYIVMASFGLDFVIFWAFLTFFLNFIPSIGSVIAVALPAFLSLVQFEAYYTFVFMTSILSGIQVLMGNIIEPKFMGNKLNMSPLFIIFSLGFWGSLWGVIGMLLAVPITIIINIILAKIPSTRPIAILLSEKGDLQIEDFEVEKTSKKLINKIKNKIKGKGL